MKLRVQKRGKVFGSIQLLAACCFVGKEIIVERKRTHHSNCLKKLDKRVSKKEVRYLDSIRLLAACCFVGKEIIVERKGTSFQLLKKLNACSKKR